MKRIKFVIAGRDREFELGDERVLPDAEADIFISRGVAIDTQRIPDQMREDALNMNRHIDSLARRPEKFRR